MVFPAASQETRPEEESTGEEREDTQEILAALEEVGQSASAAELRSWSMGPATRPDDSQASFLGWSRGEILTRWSGKELGQSVGQAKLDLGNSWSRWRGRVEWGPGSAGLKSGAVELRKGRQSLVVGILGIKSGAGLLVATPGRNGGLVADAGFSRPGGRIALWSSAPDHRTIRGVGLDLGRGPWSMRILSGSRVVHDGAPALIRAVTISRQTKTLAWGGGVVGLGSQFGYSIWVNKRSGPLQWRGEWACWHNQESQNADRVLEAVVNWKPGKNWGVETGWAMANGGRPIPLAARSAFLRGDEGKGWASRGWWRSSAGVKYCLLWAQALTRKTRPSSRRYAHSNLDLTATWKLHRSTEVLLRFRTTGYQQWGWSERFRWAAPLLEHQEQQQHWQGGVAWSRGPLVVRFKLKHLLRAKDESAGRRSLYRITGQNAWGRLRLRWAYGSAWGDDVDLVDAVSPVPGLVHPRHWGKWQTETQFGAGLDIAGLEIWLAGVSRRSTPGAVASGSSQFWGLIERKW